MDRRELIRQIALLTGATFIGSEWLLSGCKAPGSQEAGFTAAYTALLDEVGETIIPATATPGAKAAQVGNFMKTFVTDCYTEKEQQAFIAGMTSLDEACKKMHGKSFADCDAEKRKSFLLSLEKEAKAYNEKNDKENQTRSEENKLPGHYYTMMKQLTLFGFFTSKTGATETLRHVSVPGRYDGAFAYKPGDKAWAE
jgi:hypothetical protein